MNTSSNGKAGRVLVVGSSGKFAGLVVPELAKRGVKVRGLVRKRSESDGVIANGASEIAIGDLSNQQSMKSAFEGVESVFYIAPAFIPNEAEVGKANVRAAKRSWRTPLRLFVCNSSNSQ